MSKLSKYINESTSSQLKLALAGYKPTIKTFGIMTPENPMGELISPKENKLLVDEFKEHLSTKRYGYRVIDGHFGGKEHSFFIPNITIKDLTQFSLEYNQESFIYGHIEQKGLPIFEYWQKSNTGNYHKEFVRKVFVDIDRDEYYSEYKGKKFIIPFFDDAKDVTFKNGYMIDNKGNKISLTLNDRGDLVKSHIKEMLDDIIYHINISLDENIYPTLPKKTEWSQYIQRHFINVECEYDYFTIDEEINYKKYITYKKGLTQ